MYIRSKSEAMDAMGAILDLPGRPTQIIQATVKLALCLDPEARAFMVDVQAALIEGGLDALRKRREAAMAHLTDTKIRRRAPGIDVKKDALLAEIGEAIDLLKMVKILSDVFPAAAVRHPQWELARFIHDHQPYVREAVEAGLRRRGKPEHATLETKVVARIEEEKPWWPEWAESIKQACAHYVHTLAKEGEVHPGANDPETLFYLIAMKEDRARDVLRHMAGTSQDVKDYLSGLRTRLNLVLLAQQEEAGR
ncbi:MAG TPA: hypothetical protein VKW04_18125 [Planctomycetota bacterium]|nr:hypothetical protein [Planctomycetota bacterium]